MPIIVINPGGGGGGGGGSVAWGDITGKPTIQTTVGNPGSDANFVSEQAVREMQNRNKVQGFAFSIEAPEAREYVITDDWPMDVDCEIIEITSRGVGGGATADWKIGSTSITGASAIDVTTSAVETAPSAANVLVEGNALSVTLSDVDELCTEIRFTVKYERDN